MLGQPMGRVHAVMHSVVHAMVCALGLAAGATQAASFPCTGRLTPVERQICGDATLSQLDDYLLRYYAAARLALKGGGAECLAADQRGWLRSVRNACGDAACLKDAYVQRLSVLDGLQPGATALQSLALPPGPALVWVVPPAADEVAAPRVGNLPPLEASGRLIDEVAAGDGHVLQDAAGRRHVVVATMFLDDSAARLSALGALSRESGVRYQVRGRAEAGGGGERHFAQGACRYVYRLP